MPKVKTRKNMNCSLFGASADLDSHNAVLLPTYEDIIRCYFHVHVELKGDGSKKPSTNEVARIVAKKVETIWERASLPTVSYHRICAMITSYHTKYRNIIKPKTGRNTPFLNAKLAKFKKEAGKIFDVCSCKCSEINKCTCQKERKVAPIEWTFLQDQRTERKMGIGRVDIKTTQTLQKKISRNTKSELKFATTSNELFLGPSTSSFQCEDSTSSVPESLSCQTNMSPSTSSGSTSSDEEFKWSYSLDEKKVKSDDSVRGQMRASMINTAKSADLTGVSNRAVAKIATAVLLDMKLVSERDNNNIIDKNKIRRAIAKNRKQLQNEDSDRKNDIRGLYFDGRKDRTLVYLNNRQATITEEHIALIEEPGNKYFAHLSFNQSVKAVTIADAILSHLQKRNVNIFSWSVIGCDGTNVNTGWKAGAIRTIEEKIGKPLQWCICLLHGNELPLRHLLQKIDGDTKGPYSYSGPLGLQLTNCEKKAVTNFQQIATFLPEVDNEDDLSSDQQYLYKITCAIRDGKCDDRLANKSPGKMSHARWLTTANRVLRLYIATSDPSEELKMLTRFIVRVYAPMWFEIKTKPFCQYGAKHVWKTIHLSRDFPENFKIIIDKVIAANAYFAHPENVLLAMLTDSRDHIRELAVRRILKARKENCSGIRYFKVPKLNFQATDYIDLINWTETTITEPPLTKHLKNEELEFLVKEKIPLEIPRFPCHTQSVERCVKLITEASLKVFGEDSRDGYIRSKLQAREHLPSFENKGQYFASKSRNK